MKRILILFLSALPLAAVAQGDDFGLDFTLEAKKKLNSKWSISLEGEWRSRDNAKTNDRWSAGLAVDYKVAKWLKASAGYTFLYDHNEKTNNSGKKYADYWGTRHRFNVSLTASQRLGDFKFSLRERWQYTYRPEKTVQRYYVSDGSEADEHTYTGKGKNVLRSRFQIEYDKKNFALKPYANVELFNAWSLEKTRLTVGTDWELSKQHSLGAFYRYQIVNSNDFDDEVNRHILGLTYKFTF